MHYVTVAALVLGALAELITCANIYAQMGDKVELPCSYAALTLEPGETLQWVNAGDKEGLDTAKNIISVFNQVFDSWRDAYVSSLNKTSSLYKLSIRVHWTNQSGTYRCQYVNEKQTMTLAEYRLVAFGGDIQLIDWPPADADSVHVNMFNPASINFTVVAYNDVHDFITVRAGGKELTAAMSCQASVDSAERGRVNNTCSVSTSTLSQSDDGVLLSIDVKLPNYPQAHSLQRPLVILTPPIVDCPAADKVERGKSFTILCKLRYRGNPARLVWQFRGMNIITLETNSSHAEVKGFSAHLDRQDRSDIVTTTLHIEKMEESSYGTYTLVAANDVGATSDPTELSLEEIQAVKPSLVRDSSTGGGMSEHKAGLLGLMICVVSFFARATFALHH